jgi:hypothetical protein
MSDTWETATPRRRRPPATYSTAAANTHNVNGFEYLTSDNFEKYFNEKVAPHLAGIEEKVRNSFRLQLNTNEEIKQNLAETRAQTAPLLNEIEGQKLEIAHLQATINELRDVVKSLSTTPRVPNPRTPPPLPPRPATPPRQAMNITPPVNVWMTVGKRTRDAIKASPSTTQAKNLAPTTPPKLAASTFPRTEREVVVCFDSLLQSSTPTTAAAARHKVNSAMYTIDQKIIPFIVARFSRNQNLV